MFTSRFLFRVMDEFRYFCLHNIIIGDTLNEPFFLFTVPYYYCFSVERAPLEKGIEFAVTANNRIFHSPRLLRELQRRIWASIFLPHVNNYVDFYVLYTELCNRIRTNFRGGRWCCFAYSIVISVLMNLKLKRRVRRPSCFGFQRGGDERAIPFRANGGLPSVIRAPPWNVEFRVSLMHEILKNIPGESRQ